MAGVGAAVGETVWQIDPLKCTRCGKCSVACELVPSAVKCVNNYSLCGYCRYCFGFFKPDIAADKFIEWRKADGPFGRMRQVPGPTATSEGVPTYKMLCVVHAMTRKEIVPDKYYEYTVEENTCIGCGKCVDGCALFGNSALQLQVRHDLCLHCNECSIAVACPENALVRVPASTPYILAVRTPRRLTHGDA